MSKPTKETRTSSSGLTGDAASLVGILDWARATGVDVSKLTVGAVSIELRGAVATGDRDERDPAPAGQLPAIYGEFGAELIAAAGSAEKLPGVDLQPAIGRRAG